MTPNMMMALQIVAALAVAYVVFCTDWLTRDYRKGGVNTEPSKVVTRPDAPASMNADTLVDRIRLLEAKDGDLIVVTIDERISIDTANRIQIMFEDVVKAIGRKAKVVVLDKGTDIKVVRTSDLV
ncbi:MULTISPECIES: hypothetical protein [unclassified Phyllobacterium]|uniref:hypothetical protein n=1 Tax=unclassified Phyllobacterium TaxID=2638441 RepID=UPI003012B569